MGKGSIDGASRELENGSACAIKSSVLTWAARNVTALLGDSILPSPRSLSKREMVSVLVLSPLALGLPPSSAARSCPLRELDRECVLAIGPPAVSSTYASREKKRTDCDGFDIFEPWVVSGRASTGVRRMERIECLGPLVDGVMCCTWLFKCPGVCCKTPLGGGSDDWYQHMQVAYESELTESIGLNRTSYLFGYWQGCSRSRLDRVL